MRTLLVALASLAALGAGPSMAQEDHSAHHPPAAADAKPVTPDATAASMHERCKAMMGSRMDPKQPHDHMREKSGPMTWPNGKPLSAAEMEKMHKDCAARMQDQPPAPAPK